jgi:hypothetical protein
VDKQEWISKFKHLVDLAGRDMYAEVFPPASFCDWRISYGQVKHTEYWFLSFYPPFCTTRKGIFHYKEVAIPDLKQYLNQQGVAIRI